MILCSIWLFRFSASLLEAWRFVRKSRSVVLARPGSTVLSTTSSKKECRSKRPKSRSSLAAPFQWSFKFRENVRCTRYGPRCFFWWRHSTSHDHERRRRARRRPWKRAAEILFWIILPDLVTFFLKRTDTCTSEYGRLHIYDFTFNLNKR